ncbi:MAG: hypothetical protein J3K34DRAFT_421936 [Monoraphidium minutum]|nr:MAG: hypothetical protein J3K34DRAFT_421936 [Monoraphidium minutum]
MRALEEVAALAGEREIYLHLRFKDDAEAGQLYRRLGYQEQRRDAFWVGLFQDRRRLMVKRVGGGSGGSSSVSSSEE